MIQFKVSAPGKVILFGEHAVVYKKTAVAASLNLRTTLKFAELPKSDLEDIIKIEFPDIKLSLNLPLCIVLDFFFSDNFDYSLIENSDQLHGYVKDFIDSIENVIDKNNSDVIIKQQKLSLQAFFYLLVYIAYKEQIDIKKTSFHVHLSTELMVSAGLGSSASFAVCLAACFLHWSLLQKGAHDTFDINELNKISKYALNCEQIMHKSPSGIDNSVCTYGSIIKFQETLIDTLPHVPNLKILLVNSNVIRSTKDQVTRTACLKSLYPSIILPVLESINALSNNAWETLKISSQAHNTDPSIKDLYKTLSVSFISMNFNILFL